MMQDIQDTGILPKPGIRRVVISCFVCVWIICISAYSQTCCSGGVPLGGSFAMGAADAKSIEVLFTYDYNSLNHLVHISDKIDDNSRTRTTQSAILELNYGINHRFSVATVVPFIRQTRLIKGFEGNEDFTTAQGLGDIVFLLKYRIIESGIDKPFQWIIGAGPKIPSGQTDFANNQGITLPADMQPGSGSLDGIVWNLIQRDRFLIPNLALTSVITYRYSGTNKNYNEVQSYRFGNEFQLGLGANYNVYLPVQFSFSLFSRYRHQQPDYLDGSKFPSSGGQWLYLIPGFSIPVHKNMSLRLSSELPVYRKLEGTQLTTGYKVTAAISFTIPLKKNKLLILENK